MYDNLLIQIKAQDREKERLVEELEKLQSQQTLLNKVIDLYNILISNSIDTKQYIEKTITEVLNVTLPNYDLSYKLEPVIKDGLAVGLKETLFEGTEEIEISSHGVKDMISIGYVLLTLSLKPQLTPVLFIDEPAPHLNSSKIPTLIALFTDLAKLLKIQFACITHCNEASGEATYMVEKTKSGSTIKAI